MKRELEIMVRLNLKRQGVGWANYADEHVLKGNL